MSHHDTLTGTTGTPAGTTGTPTGPPAALKERIAGDLQRSRRRVHALTACDDAELLAPRSPRMSPLVGDLAHVGSQEELWLVRDVLDRVPLERSPLLEQGFASAMIVRHDQQHAETMLATHQLRAGDQVRHVPWCESETYARWAGRRLPTEAEREKAARDTARGRAMTQRAAVTGREA